MNLSNMNFELFKFRVTVKPEYFLLLAYVGYFLVSGTNMSLLLAFPVYAFIFTFIILMHEMSHGLAARKLGYRAKDITLMMMGGVLALPNMNFKKPLHEAFVSIAGPVSNFLAVMIVTPLYYYFVNPSIHEVILAFISLNLTFGIFNLFPMFPMDGGRVLRSTLQLYFKYDVATAIAHKVALVMGCALLCFSLYNLLPIAALISCTLIYINYNKIDA